MSYQFNNSGTDDYATASYSSYPNALTVSLWVKKENESADGSFGYLLSQPTSGGALGVNMAIGAGNGGGALTTQLGSFFDWTGNYTWRNDSTTNRDIGSAWTHVVVTYDSSAAGSSNAPVIYVNGSAVGLTSVSDSSGSKATANGSWVIGNRGSDLARDFKGRVAEVAFFDRILTGGQITALAGGDSPMDTGTVGTNPVWYNRMKDGNTGSNAQVGTLTINSATLQSGDNPTVDDPPSGGSSVVKLMQHYN